MNIKFQIFILVIILFAGCNSGENKPNVILIMADDLGYNDLSCYGSERISTPNIDFLAHNGIRFLDYHSSGAVCSPTRAALMTGRYQQRSGIEGVITAKSHRHTGMSLDEYTMAEYFKSIDYKTALIGKWHLGYDTAFSPVNQGFDFFKGYVSGNVDYHSHVDQEGYFDWWKNKTLLEEEGYTTDLITEASIDFIKRSKNEPFFLYIAHEAPHGPFQGRNDRVLRKAGPDFRIPGPKIDAKRAYIEMVEVMDEGIGKLMDCLEENELKENTIVFFCSDNGAARYGSNLPLKGHKASVWEGGHRVPAIAFWEGKISRRENASTLVSMDLFPTLVEICGKNDVNMPAFDGLSFANVLSPDYRGDELDGRKIFWRFGNRKALRKDNWKLVVNGSDKFLYDLDMDLSEQNNLFEQKADIAAAMMKSLDQWEKEMAGYLLRSR